MCELADYAGLKLDKIHREILETELDLWHRAYLPVKGIVLDIGAGNGETAQFYLKHGAEHVICIEPDATLLYENFGKDPRITIVPSWVDSIKSDCEGAEIGMVVEAHRPVRLKQLYRFPRNNVTGYRLTEDWGSPLRKALRKIGEKLI